MKQEGRKLDNKNPRWCRWLQVKVRVRTMPSSAEALRALGGRRETGGAGGWGAGLEMSAQAICHVYSVHTLDVWRKETQTSETGVHTLAKGGLWDRSRLGIGSTCPGGL